MAKYWTLAEIKEKIEKDLDIEGEVFVQPTELLGYINEGIDEAEAEIHSVYEDYFLADDFVTLVAGQQEYDLPSDIYARKIRRIIYSDQNAKTYQVARISETSKFEDIALTERFRSTEFYRYIIKNDMAGTPKIYFVPAIREGDVGSGDRMRVWYLRNANRLAVDSDVCDIPEFVHFVIAYAKLRILEKEGHPNMSYWLDQTERQRRLMINTLSNSIPDGDTRIDPDMSTYEEMS